MSGERWWNWLAHGHEEFPRARDRVSASPTLWGCGALFWVSRRLSPLEHWKHYRYSREPGSRSKERIPASLTEGWILGGLALSCLALALGDRVPPDLRPILGWLGLFLAIQKLLHDTYHLVWRWLIHPGHQVHAVVRSLVLALLSYIQMMIFFAWCYYWALGDQVTHAGGRTLAETGPVAALYFSASVSATLGFGDFAPATGGARGVVIVQLVVSLVLLGVLVGRTVGSLRALQDEE
jgi:hypothetical protein